LLPAIYFLVPSSLTLFFLLLFTPTLFGLFTAAFLPRPLRFLISLLRKTRLILFRMLPPVLCLGRLLALRFRLLLPPGFLLPLLFLCRKAGNQLSLLPLSLNLSVFCRSGFGNSIAGVGQPWYPL
jgi:hypothetical protein